MANNFLRYKYYLITRASAVELETAVEEIFGTLGFFPKAKLANAMSFNTDFKGDFVTEFTALLLTLLKTEIPMEMKGAVEPTAKISESMKTEPQLMGMMHGVSFEGKVSETEHTGMNTSADMALSASIYLLRHVYSIVLNWTASNEIRAHPVLKDTLKTGAKTEIIGTITAYPKSTTPIKTGLLADGTMTVEAELSVADLLKTEPRIVCTGNIEALAQAIETARTQPKVDGALGVTPGITLYKISQLSDYDSETLDDMDSMSLDALDYIEI